MSDCETKGTSGYNPMENGRGDRFRYDDEGQLVEAWYNAADPAKSGAGNNRYDGFSYDELGNRENRVGSNFVASHGPMTFTRKDNGLNQYSGWSPYCYIHYDDDVGGTWGAPHAANGVQMQDGNTTAGFNSLNQPMMILGPGMSAWEYFGYDPLGRCVKRSIGGDGSAATNPATYFYYEGWNLIQEGPGYNSASRNYIHGARVDEVVKQITPTNWWERYFHYDARGHCTLQTDASGNIVEQYEYDAFGYPYFFDGSGNAIGSYDAHGIWRGYSPWGNRFLFTGREYLSELALYDYRNRMYQPELGRFLQPDPKEFGAGDYNLYRYCHNDPVNKSDPAGLYVVYSGTWSEADAKNFKELFEKQWNTPEGRQQWEARYNSDLPSIVSPYRAAPAASNGGASNFVIADTKPLRPADNSLTPFGQTPRTQQDKRLSEGEIKALERGDVDVHELKGKEGASQRDLFKDPFGNIKVKPKDGSGPGDPTGLNINDFRPFLR